MQQRAKAYQVIRDELYKTSVTGPLLCCLSKDNRWRIKTCHHLPGMPEVFTKFQGTIATYNTFVAIAEMGHWHYGTIDNRTRKLQICSGSGRILHQMDRGEASSQYSSSGAQEIFLAKLNMLFQGA
jgi:hypothetical protein